uniref:Prokaryotic-type class I peptide chain release factors domain-containing protein n=1 Tax=Candidozyma auris TaxID=498019 RepID=A0A0L0NXR6_CANAR
MFRLPFSLRRFTTSTVVNALPKKNKMPPRPMWLIKEDEIREEFIKGGRGPGGQKINKTNSKVQLTHLPTGKVVTCQYSRSQEKNRKRAREILAMKLEEMQDPENCRSAVIAKRKTMVKQNKAKKLRRKYAKLEEERSEEEDEVNEEGVDIEVEVEQFLKRARGEK